MLQPLGSIQPTFLEATERALGLDHYLAIAKRRIFYFLIPFVVVLLFGALIVAIQRPIYRAEGKILVETQDIPKDLVRPTITDTANQRIQVIQQKIMTRDNLLQVVKKFGLFAAEQQWMSPSQILDLMKERTQFQLVDLGVPSQPNNLTIAFTLGFDYENPQIAAAVANEFLTLILNVDVVNRTNRAGETTKFLEQEVQRLQGVLAATQTRITELTANPDKGPSDQFADQRAELNKLKLDLVQKSAIYSGAHPEVIALQKRIAALEKLVAKTPDRLQSDNGISSLKQQLTATETNLDEANKKLSEARLGESLERNQQSERLQVIEQPVPPQKPIKPNRPKLLALVFILAGVAGFGALALAETLDKSIHSSQELATVVDSRLIVGIPYITTASETGRKKNRLVLLMVGLGLLALAALGTALYLGLSLDLSSWVDRSWLERLTRLSK